MKGRSQRKAGKNGRRSYKVDLERGERGEGNGRRKSEPKTRKRERKKALDKRENYQ